MPTIKLDDQGRILLPADLRAKLNMKPGDEFIIGETISDSILLKRSIYVRYSKES